MNLQVLVSTIDQDNHDILEKMNIKSDAIIVNQCDKNEFEELNYNGHSIKFLNLLERGVGLSRNTALMRAEANICLFGDDDVSYIDDYKKIIIDEFNRISKADVIIFNLPSTHLKNGRNVITKSRRLHFYNCLKFGTPQIAVRLDSIRKANIHFSLLFGGGAKYSAGEDSLFLVECLRKGLKIYSSTESIGSVSQQESTWFNGYTYKYFFDKGVLYATISKKVSYLLCFQFCLRHRKMFVDDMKWIEAFKIMLKGRKEIIKN